jgi:uncharacterized protein
MSGFLIDVADLLAHPGARREVTVTDVLADLAGSGAAVSGPITVAMRLERIPDGIVARGEVRAHWSGECSYCLRDLDEEMDLHVDELFETAPIEGETYPIDGHQIDLEQLIRDAVLLELPLAPHCNTPCAPEVTPGASDDDAGDAADPRWAALSELDIR